VYHKKVQQANQQRAREEFHRLRDPTNLARGLRPDSIRHLEDWALTDVEVRVCMAEDIQDDGTFRLDRMPFVPTDGHRLVHSRCQLDEWIVVRNRFVYARMGAWSALRLVAVNVGTENRQRFVVTSAATIGLIFENNLDRGVNGRKVNIEPAWKAMGLDHLPRIVKRAIWGSFLEHSTIDSCFMPKHPETTADEAGIFEDFAPNQAHINPVEYWVVPRDEENALLKPRRMTPGMRISDCRFIITEKGVVFEVCTGNLLYRFGVIRGWKSAAEPKLFEDGEAGTEREGNGDFYDVAFTFHGMDQELRLVISSILQKKNITGVLYFVEEGAVLSTEFLFQVYMAVMTPRTCQEMMDFIDDQEGPLLPDAPVNQFMPLSVWYSRRPLAKCCQAVQRIVQTQERKGWKYGIDVDSQFHSANQSWLLEQIAGQRLWKRRLIQVPDQVRPYGRSLRGRVIVIIQLSKVVVLSLKPSYVTTARAFDKGVLKKGISVS